MALHPPPAACSSPTRPDDFATCARTKPTFMYIPALIFRMIVNLVKQAWLLPRTVALALQHKRDRFAQDQCEIERLDRIRNPSKYAGR
jgi:hypothetical protein